MSTDVFLSFEAIWVSISRQQQFRAVEQAGVQHVQELVLRALLVREEVNVIDGQEIQSSQLLAESFQIVFAYGADVFVCELLGRVVADSTELSRSSSHCTLKQVGFANAAIAMQKQG